MIEGQASLTALLVTFARAVSHADPALHGACSDDKARSLLPSALGALIDRHPALPSLFRRAGFGMIEHMALRTALIDEAVTEAVARGMRQVVILGAGLDARGNRLEALRDSVVFEVDHPDTQRVKRERAAALGQKAREIRYAGCDFRDDALERSLAHAGHDPNVPTCFIWEGVTLYLPREAVEQTLDVIQRRAAPGSRLVLTYIAAQRSGSLATPTRLAALGLALLGEPLRFWATKPEMRALLDAHGFTLLTNELPYAQGARFGVKALPWTVAVPERVVVAERSATPVAERGTAA